MIGDDVDVRIELRDGRFFFHFPTPSCSLTWQDTVRLSGLLVVAGMFAARRAGASEAMYHRLASETYKATSDELSDDHSEWLLPAHWPGCWRAHPTCADALGVTVDTANCSRNLRQAPACVLPEGHESPHVDTRGRTLEGEGL